MDPIIGSALIQAGGSLFNNQLGHAQSMANMARQRQFEAKMFDKSWTKNLEFWNMQNKYNSPKEMMARLKEAGLNPRLIYGMGMQAGGNAGAPAQAPTRGTSQLPQVEPVQIPDAIGKYFALKAANATIDNTEANTGLTQKEAGLRNIQFEVQNYLHTARSGEGKSYLIQDAIREKHNNSISKKLGMDLDNQLKAQAADRGRYSYELAKEEYEQGKIKTQQMAKDLEISDATLLGQTMGNEYLKHGVTSEGLKAFVNVLKANNATDYQIAQALVGAKVGEQIIRNIVPTAVAGKVLGRIGNKAGKAVKTKGSNSGKIKTKEKWNHEHGSEEHFTYYD